MKNIKYSLIGLALLGAGFTSCQDSYDAPELETPVATMKPNTTLADFKEFLETSITDAGVDAVVVPKREDGSDYILHGRVISSDASGNIYQNLVIQDETAALTLSIREASMWTNYRVGQEVVLDATGLYMGSYSGLYQLGWLDDYYGAPSMTFMSWYMFKEHSQMNGLPNQNFKYVSLNGEWPSENPYCIVTTIEELSALSATTTQGRNAMSQLVEIQNVSFVDGGKDTYAEYQESNERRYVQDALGNKIALNNSGYATFHNDTLPEGIGTVRGILGYYQEAWQLTIRDLGDVIFDEEGTQESPYTVAEGLAQENNGRTGWTRGYIVGSVKSGVAAVTSSDDIEFSANGETFNNVVIADNANEKDWTKCMIVELPANSLFRQYVNLVENDYMYGKVLTVRGSFNQFMGMNGITDTGGALTDFTVDGTEFGGQNGNGTQSNPYGVDFIIMNQSAAENIWIEGYIVGFVNGANFSTDAQFNNNSANMTNYAGANVILSSAPAGQADLSNSIPARVADRNAQGLLANPSNYGKKVKVLGNTGDYLGGFGIATSSQWIFE